MPRVYAYRRFFFGRNSTPPGFSLKLLVLQAALEAGFIEIVIAAVLFAVVGAFYYLRIVKLMYFDDPRPDLLAAASHSYGPGVLISLSVNSILIVAITPWIGVIIEMVSKTI